MIKGIVFIEKALAQFVVIYENDSLIVSDMCGRLTTCRNMIMTHHKLQPFRIYDKVTNGILLD